MGLGALGFHSDLDVLRTSFVEGMSLQGLVAAWAFGRCAGPSDEGEVCQLLSHTDSVYRFAGAWGFALLGGFGDERVIQEALAGTFPESRWAGVEAARTRGGSALLGRVRPLALDPDKEVRKATLRFLGSNGSLGDFGPLTAWDSDWHGLRVGEAVVSASKRGDLADLVSLVLSDRRRGSSDLIKAIEKLLEPDDMATFLPWLDDPPSRRHLHLALHVVAKLGSRNNLPRVTELLLQESRLIEEDPDDTFCNPSCADVAFSALVGPEDIDLVRQFSRHGSRYLRNAAVKALKRLGTRADLRPLLAKLRHGGAMYFNVEESILRLLTTDDAPLVNQLLHRRRAGLRAFGLECAKDLRLNGQFDVIAEMMIHDRNAWVRRKSAETLVTLATRTSWPGLLEAARTGGSIPSETIPSDRGS